MIAARREDRLYDLAQEIGCAHRRCDVGSDADRRTLIQATLDTYGRVDILVNNAGMSSTVPAESEDVGRFEEVVRINLVAPFALAQLAARDMLTRGSGSIVNVASMLGIVGNGQVPDAAYAASKGGVVNMTRELGAQWARRGVRVNALAPGYFRSEMTTVFFTDELSQKWIQRKDPMGRPGEEHELDGALLFLASDASTYVTGQVLTVDGGWTAV